MPIADLDGMATYYEWDGPAEKPVLVLSHSLGTDLSMWQPQVASLSEHFHLLRYDTRGHGRSSIPPGPYGVEMLGQDVLGLLDSLQIESFHFCGLSMGGLIGQWLGINAAARVRKLVLCNTASKIGNEAGWNERIDAVLKNGLKPMIPGVLERWFTAGYRQHAPDSVAQTTRMLEAASPAGYAAASAAVRDADMRESVRHIHAPTLVIAGNNDLVTPPSDALRLVESIARARYIELPAAHLSNLEAADSFTLAVKDFLQA